MKKVTQQAQLKNSLSNAVLENFSDIAIQDMQNQAFSMSGRLDLGRDNDQISPL